MRFDNRTIDAKIDIACFEASKLLTAMSKMMLEIEDKNDFKYESGKGQEVYKNLLITRQPIKVFTYRPFNPWTSAIGYFDGESIHINIRKLPLMSIVDITANLLHEYAHYCGYSHGNNYKTKEKCLYSVPYWISENIGRWLC